MVGNGPMAYLNIKSLAGAAPTEYLKTNMHYSYLDTTHIQKPKRMVC